MKARILGGLLAVSLMISMIGTAFAAETPFSDVPANAAYSEAVAWCEGNGIMSGVSDTSFDPDGTLTRSMLASVLYRAEGEPAVSGAPSFSDTHAGAWYANAVVWANTSGLVQGYGNDLFGTNDPVTREQLAAILWRYAGQQETSRHPEIPDRASVSSYAAAAVDWAVSIGVMSVHSGSGFAPKANATRAEVASALYAQLSGNTEPSAPVTTGSKALVIYFSRTNNTKGIAEKVQPAVSADVFEITAQVPYTDADINYHDSTCRANQEQSDQGARPAIVSADVDLSGYDTVFLGYPIWHGQAPKVIYTFLESSEGWNNQTVIPFCTSGSSPIGSSAENLHSLLPSSIRWLDGNRFNSGTSQTEVSAWVEGLNLNQTQNHEEVTAMNQLILSFNGHTYTATLAENSSAEALKGILANGSLTIDMSDYGNMEKVGSIGQRLPTNNQQISTQAGDLILYQGNNLVIYYDRNSWNFTRLGRIDDPSGLRDALGSGDVRVTLTLGQN